MVVRDQVNNCTAETCCRNCQYRVHLLQLLCHTRIVEGVLCSSPMQVPNQGWQRMIVTLDLPWCTLYLCYSRERVHVHFCAGTTDSAH